MAKTAFIRLKILKAGKMKVRSTTSGFTLIELLTVITIIGILIGIVIGVAGNVQSKAAAGRAQAEISAIELALERFKIDNGDYPDAPDISIPTGSTGYYDGAPANYITAGQSLFLDLCGRALYSEEIDPGRTQYLEVKANQTASSGTASYFSDPFGNSYGYVYHATGNPKSFYNQVVPDIWSTAGDSTASITSANEHLYLRWVTNWGSR